MKNHIKYHQVTDDFYQGSDAWFAARCGILTASEMKLIITPERLELAKNDKASAHLYELAAQRVTRYVEPTYIGDDMLRGIDDEVFARELYHNNYGSVTEIGFITNNKWGFTLGCSPDGLVHDYGMIETKSRRQKFQFETISEGVVPTEYLIQCQTALLVSERDWLDFISYSSGMPMFVLRVEPDARVQSAIIDCAGQFEAQISVKIRQYHEAVETMGFISTERRIRQDMHT
jgi:hypothetical protein